MFWHLTILSGLSVFAAVAIFLFLLKNRKQMESLKFFLLGTLVMTIDFLVEYAGTSSGLWTYHQSVFFVVGLVPVELMFLFFSAGVMAGFLFTRMNKLKIPLRVNTIFYLLISIGLILYARQIYLTNSGTIFYISIIIGLWGFYNISERNKESALVLAILAMIVDVIAEEVVIGSGGYSYLHGFDISIPMTYGLLTLGLLAVMEKLHKLDEFLEHPVVRKLLRLLGVKREQYKKKFSDVKNRVQRRLTADKS
ncbi:MAG: hypothetical protein ACLFS3_02735 [Candidatus Aenigmatarchaeota archaeon]